MNRSEIAGQTRTHIDRTDGDEPTDIFVLIDHRALHRFGDRDGGEILRGALLLTLAAASQSRREQHSCKTRHKRRAIAELHASPLNWPGIIGIRKRQSH